VGVWPGKEDSLAICIKATKFDFFYFDDLILDILVVDHIRKGISVSPNEQ
jgi:hypothetical protein